MKKLFLTIILLLIAMNNVVGQNLNNHWQLGVSDINFSSNPPTVSTVANNGQYGNASVSDGNGNLLFYTDGTKIWNKNHQMMTNGGDINGFYSFDMTNQLNKQPAIIIPNPKDKNQFFVFTAITEHLLCMSCNEILRYKVSLVDFNNEVNPLGNVINTQELNQQEGYFGPLTFVKNATNDGYFIILQHTSGTLFSYKLTNTGLDLNSIVSSISGNIGYNQYSTVGGGRTVSSSGIIKFSPNSSKLGELVRTTTTQNMGTTTSYTYTSRFSTFDFNNSTGVFSNFQIIQDTDSYTTGIGSIIDFEFSSDSNKVYLLGNNVNVKDLLNLSQPYRSLSQFGNTSLTPTGFSNIQRDKYGNILLSSNLVTNNQNLYIHKIENQDSFSNSSVRINYISLNNNTINYLPQLIPELTPLCPNSLTVSTNVTTGIDKKQAANSITATNTISSGAGAIYHAGTSVTLKPTFTALAGSTLHVYPIGCSNTFIAKQSNTTNSPKSEEELIDTSIKSTEKIIQVAPNPNNGIFNIILKNDLKEGTIQITDLIGFTVYKANFKDQKEIEVNIQDNPKGIYIVKVFSGDQTYTEKIIKN